MFLREPYSPAEFHRQREIIRRRIWLNRRLRRPLGKDPERLNALVTAQLAAEARAARAAARAKAKADPRQADLLERVER